VISGYSGLVPKYKPIQGEEIIDVIYGACVEVRKDDGALNIHINKPPISGLF
jgi:hypothetical protein